MKPSVDQGTGQSCLWHLGMPELATLHRGNVQRVHMPNGDVLTFGLGLDRRLCIELPHLVAIAADLLPPGIILLEIGSGVTLSLRVWRSDAEVVELVDAIGAENAQQSGSPTKGPGCSRIGLAGGVELVLDPDWPNRLRIDATARWHIDFDRVDPYAFVVWAESGAEIRGQLQLD